MFGSVLFREFADRNGQKKTRKRQHIKLQTLILYPKLCNSIRFDGIDRIFDVRNTRDRHISIVVFLNQLNESF